MIAAASVAGGMQSGTLISFEEENGLCGSTQLSSTPVHSSPGLAVMDMDIKDHDRPAPSICIYSCMSEVPADVDVRFLAPIGVGGPEPEPATSKRQKIGALPASIFPGTEVNPRSDTRLEYSMEQHMSMSAEKSLDNYEQLKHAQRVHEEHRHSSSVFNGTSFHSDSLVDSIGAKPKMNDCLKNPALLEKLSGSTGSDLVAVANIGTIDQRVVDPWDVGVFGEDKHQIMRISGVPDSAHSRAVAYSDDEEEEELRNVTPEQLAEMREKLDEMQRSINRNEKDMKEGDKRLAAQEEERKVHAVRQRDDRFEIIKRIIYRHIEDYKGKNDRELPSYDVFFDLQRTDDRVYAYLNDTYGMKIDFTHMENPVSDDGAVEGAIADGVIISREIHELIPELQHYSAIGASIASMYSRIKRLKVEDELGTETKDAEVENFTKIELLWEWIEKLSTLREDLIRDVKSAAETKLEAGQYKELKSTRWWKDNIGSETNRNVGAIKALADSRASIELRKWDTGQDPLIESLESYPTARNSHEREINDLVEAFNSTPAAQPSKRNGIWLKYNTARRLYAVFKAELNQKLSTSINEKKRLDENRKILKVLKKHAKERYDLASQAVAEAKNKKDEYCTDDAKANMESRIMELEKENPMGVREEQEKLQRLRDRLEGCKQVEEDYSRAVIEEEAALRGGDDSYINIVELLEANKRKRWPLESLIKWCKDQVTRINPSHPKARKSKPEAAKDRLAADENDIAKYKDILKVEVLTPEQEAERRASFSCRNMIQLASENLDTLESTAQKIAILKEADSKARTEYAEECKNDYERKIVEFETKKQTHELARDAATDETFIPSEIATKLQEDIDRYQKDKEWTANCIKQLKTEFIFEKLDLEQMAKYLGDTGDAECSEATAKHDALKKAHADHKEALNQTKGILNAVVEYSEIEHSIELTTDRMGALDDEDISERERLKQSIVKLEKEKEEKRKEFLSGYPNADRGVDDLQFRRDYEKMVSDSNREWKNTIKTLKKEFTDHMRTIGTKIIDENKKAKTRLKKRKEQLEVIEPLVSEKREGYIQALDKEGENIEMAIERAKREYEAKLAPVAKPAHKLLEDGGKGHELEGEGYELFGEARGGVKTTPGLKGTAAEQYYDARLIKEKTKKQFLGKRFPQLFTSGCFDGQNKGEIQALMDRAANVLSKAFSKPSKQAREEELRTIMMENLAIHAQSRPGSNSILAHLDTAKTMRDTISKHKKQVEQKEQQKAVTEADSLEGRMRQQRILPVAEALREIQEFVKRKSERAIAYTFAIRRMLEGNFVGKEASAIPGADIGSHIDLNTLLESHPAVLANLEALLAQWEMLPTYLRGCAMPDPAEEITRMGTNNPTEKIMFDEKTHELVVVSDHGADASGSSTVKPKPKLTRIIPFVKAGGDISVPVMYNLRQVRRVVATPSSTNATDGGKFMMDLSAKRLFDHTFNAMMEAGVAASPEGVNAKIKHSERWNMDLDDPFYFRVLDEAMEYGKLRHETIRSQYINQIKAYQKQLDRVQRTRDAVHKEYEHQVDFSALPADVPVGRDSTGNEVRFLLRSTTLSGIQNDAAALIAHERFLQSMIDSWRAYVERMGGDEYKHEGYDAIDHRDALLAMAFGEDAGDEKTLAAATTEEDASPSLLTAATEAEKDDREMEDVCKRWGSKHLNPTTEYDGYESWMEDAVHYKTAWKQMKMFMGLYYPWVELPPMMTPSGLPKKEEFKEIVKWLYTLKQQELLTCLYIKEKSKLYMPFFPTIPVRLGVGPNREYPDPDWQPSFGDWALVYNREGEGLRYPFGDRVEVYNLEGEGLRYPSDRLQNVHDHEDEKAASTYPPLQVERKRKAVSKFIDGFTRRIRNSSGISQLEHQLWDVGSANTFEVDPKIFAAQRKMWEERHQSTYVPMTTTLDDELKKHETQWPNIGDVEADNVRQVRATSMSMILHSSGQGAPPPTASSATSFSLQSKKGLYPPRNRDDSPIVLELQDEDAKQIRLRLGVDKVNDSTAKRIIKILTSTPTAWDAEDKTIGITACLQPKQLRDGEGDDRKIDGWMFTLIKSNDYMGPAFTSDAVPLFHGNKNPKERKALVDEFIRNAKAESQNQPFYNAEEVLSHIGARPALHTLKDGVGEKVTQAVDESMVVIMAQTCGVDIRVLLALNDPGAIRKPTNRRGVPIRPIPLEAVA